MRDKLLKSPKAKTGKNGRYMVIPFDHSTSNPSGSLANALGAIAKQEVSRAGIKGFQRSPGGNVKVGQISKIKRPSEKGQTQLGLLESLASPNLFKQAILKESGKQGDVGSYLDDMKVSQKIKIGRKGKMKVSKNISTFRTLSENSPAGTWQHPGNAGVKLFDDALQWAEEQWESSIKPELLSLLKNS